MAGRDSRTPLRFGLLNRVFYASLKRMTTDGEPILSSPIESRKDALFRDKIEKVRGWNKVGDVLSVNGNEVIAAFTVSDILKEYGYGKERDQDWKANIAELNPAILDLGCGSDHDDVNRATQWFPYIPVIFGTHGADPKRIVGVDLMPFKYASGIYTHVTTDLVSTVKSGNLEEFLKPYTPEDKFDAVIVNNLFDSPEMSETLRKGDTDEFSFRAALREQFLPILREDGIVVLDEHFIRRKPKTHNNS